LAWKQQRLQSPAKCPKEPSDGKSARLSIGIVAVSGQILAGDDGKEAISEAPGEGGSDI
jgi:hypothetical protein